MNKGHEMKFEDLSPEQKAKVEGCKSPEEVFALAKAEGYELSADELDAITGGMVDTSAPTGGVGKGW